LISDATRVLAKDVALAFIAATAVAQKEGPVFPPARASFTSGLD
jgi:hypothetical protein